MEKLLPVKESKSKETLNAKKKKLKELREQAQKLEQEIQAESSLVSPSKPKTSKVTKRNPKLFSRKRGSMPSMSQSKA